MEKLVNTKNTEYKKNEIDIIYEEIYDLLDKIYKKNNSNKDSISENIQNLSKDSFGDLLEIKICENISQFVILVKLIKNSIIDHYPSLYTLRLENINKMRTYYQIIRSIKDLKIIKNQYEYDNLILYYSNKIIDFFRPPSMIDELDYSHIISSDESLMKRVIEMKILLKKVKIKCLLRYGKFRER